MAYLSQFGTLKYNGFEFTGPRNSVEVKMINQLDSSGRYVTHSVYRVSVDCWITSSVDGTGGDGSSAASRMQSVKQALSKNGGVFILTGMGFGDLSVNTNATTRDVNFGPKVQFLNMRNIGSGCIACMWVVDVAVNSCAGVEFGVTGKIKEYVYNASWEIMPNGCTRRTVSGHIAIFNNTTAADGTSVLQTADQYRNNVYIPLHPGFLRNEPQQYSLSDDKMKLSFTVTDNEQLSENTYPPGVAAMDMEHTVDAELLGVGGGFMNQTCTFTGWMEMAKPYDVGLGWSRALLIMQERLVHAVNTNECAPMILSLSLTESMFRRRISWRLKYRLLATSLQNFIDGSGLFRKVTSTTYKEYINSMQQAWSNRGAAGLEHDQTSDVFVSQCNQNGRFVIKDKLSRKFLRTAKGIIALQCPPKKNSYLVWNNYIDILSKNTAIQLQEMPRPGFPPRSKDRVTSTSVLGQEIAIKKEEKRNIEVQQSGGGAPMVQVVVRGRSFRVGYAPVIPKLLKVMGRDAGFVMSKGDTTVTVAGYANGGKCPIYAVTWYNVYEIKFDSIEEMNAALGKIDVNSAVFDTEGIPIPKVGGV